MKSIGLYLHFPFCVQKCRYCDFPSWAGREDLMVPYLEALFREMESYRELKNSYEVSTIYMGGGTPTLFDGHSLARVLEKCRECFTVQEDAEVSVECNPGTADRNKLKLMADAGINRLSIGLQAWQDRLLEYLGRIHRRQQFADTVQWAKEAGFVNISADVIFGIPGQTLEEWLETLRETVVCGVTHLSAYSLKVEEGTAFHNWKLSGRLQEMDEEKEREMYHKGAELLEQLGLRQYEISNFARDGYACRHNLIYWKNGEYIGCGSGAHSYMNHVRRANVKNITAYIGQIRDRGSAIEYQEETDRETELFETLMLGFRLKEGISKTDFLQRFGFSLPERYSRELDMLKEKGLIVEDENAYRPTPLGLDFENSIALAFME